MAVRLAASLTTIAFDVAPERVRLAVEGGAVAAVSPADAARTASIVLVSVRNKEQFEQSMFGPAGAAEAMAEGTIVVLTSTIGTEVASTVASRLAAQGVSLLDAPVSGGATRAAAGGLVIMAGADEALLKQAKPVLELLASTVFVAGPRPGDGQTMKTVNQLLCGVHTAAAAEALTLASRLGLDLDAVIPVLGAGAAGSFMLADRGPRMAQQLAGVKPELRSRLDVISKDMGIVHDLARQAGVSTPLAAAAEQAYLAMEARGYAAQDDSVMVTFSQSGSATA